MKERAEGTGGSDREHAAPSDSAQFAKSTSSTLTRRQSSGEHGSRAPIPTALSLPPSLLQSPSPLLPNLPQTPSFLCDSLSLHPYPSRSLHNATLAEDGEERTHSFRIPPDPTTGSCSWVYYSKQRGRNKPSQPQSSDCNPDTRRRNE